MKINYHKINKKRGAFTLLEVLAVIVIVALLSSLLIPAVCKAKNVIYKSFYSSYWWNRNRIECALNYEERETGLEYYLTNKMAIMSWSHVEEKGRD